MIFQYKKLPGCKPAPIVPLYLKGKNRWILFNAFVDTGADYSVFHGSVAEIVGVKLLSGQKKIVTVGDGDHMAVYVHRIPVRFSSRLFEAKIAFSESLGSGFNLLGRETFFETFQFCFNDRSRILRTTFLK